jgi:hypothetical protein
MEQRERTSPRKVTVATRSRERRRREKELEVDWKVKADQISPAREPLDMDESASPETKVSDKAARAHRPD